MAKLLVVVWQRCKPHVHYWMGLRRSSNPFSFINVMCNWLTAARHLFMALDGTKLVKESASLVVLSLQGFIGMLGLALDARVLRAPPRRPISVTPCPTVGTFAAVCGKVTLYGAFAARCRPSTAELGSGIPVI